MTPHHILFIPAVFLLGVAAGALGSRPTLAGLRNVRWTLLTLALFLLVFAVTHMLPLAGGPVALRAALGGLPLFDQSPVFTAAEVHARLAAYGGSGRLTYARFTYTADIVFPASLFAFLWQLAREAGARTPQGRSRWLMSLAPVWFATDMLENASIHHLLVSFPLSQDRVAEALGILTVVKFVLLGSAVVAPAVVWVWARRRAGPTPPPAAG